MATTIYCQDNEMTWFKLGMIFNNLVDFTKQTVTTKKIQSLQQDVSWSGKCRVVECWGNPMTLDDWHNRESKAPKLCWTANIFS